MWLKKRLEEEDVDLEDILAPPFQESAKGRGGNRLKQALCNY